MSRRGLLAGLCRCTSRAWKWLVPLLIDLLYIYIFRRRIYLCCCIVVVFRRVLWSFVFAFLL
jgi:hypothetical protein